MWLSRIIIGLCVIWLFTLGPGTMLLPCHLGFSSATDEGITICFQDGVSPEMVDRIKGYAQTAQAQALGFWGKPPGGLKTVTVFLCNSRGGYKQLSLGAGGNASCAGSNILLYPQGVGDRNLEAIIGHEMSHAILRQHVGYLRGFALPVWMDEGVATYLGTPSWASPQRLREYLQDMPRPQLVSAKDLNTTLEWGSAVSQLGRVGVQYAYARCLSEYLIQNYGQEEVKSFIMGASFLDDNNRRFESTYGIDLGEVEKSWLVQAKTRGHLPSGTEVVAGVTSPGAVRRHCLKYAFLLVCILWFVRQSCRLLRFLWRRRGQGHLKSSQASVPMVWAKTDLPSARTSSTNGKP